MPYCCTWLIVLACWLLWAPSLGRLPYSISAGLAALFLAITSSCCPNSHNTFLLYSVSLLVPVNLLYCFSLFHSVLTCNSSVCVAIHLRWLSTVSLLFRPLTVQSLWAPSFSALLLFFFFFFSSPPSHRAPNSFSVVCWVWVCDIGIYKKQLPLILLLSHLHYLNFTSLLSWYNSMKIKDLHVSLKLSPLLKARLFKPLYICIERLKGFISLAANKAENLSTKGIKN